tara:strand:- start:1166 stop:1642 length:477 start_codon:yes stop_codon:yes gene_type:complete
LNPFKKRRKWWDSGLKFSCLPDCGKCCNEPEGIVYLSLKDMSRLASYHNLSLNEWIKRDCRKSSDGRYILKSNQEKKICIYFNDDLNCDVYDSKPDQCSAFPWWNENLVDKNSWEKTKEICPGIDHPKALIINKKTINFWIEVDKVSEKGVKDSELSF